MVWFQVREEPETQAEGPPSKKQKSARNALPDSSSADDFVSAFPDEDLPQAAVAAVKEVVEKKTVVEKDAKLVDGVPAKKEKKGKGKKAAADAPAIIATPASGDAAFDGECRQKFWAIRIADVSRTVATALPEWSQFKLPTPLFRALAELKFTKPTEIQSRALSVEIGASPYVPSSYVPIVAEEEEEEWGGIQDDDAAAEVTKPALPPKPFVSAFEAEPEFVPRPTTTDRDLVGVAQTGSGKTLAYGLPILSYILSNPAPSTSELPPDDAPPFSRLVALILAPTRELALQVRAAISEVGMRTNELLPDELQDPNVNATRKRERKHHISVVALTGGMSVEKQKRQLSRGADVLVATPGRLWDLIGEVGSFSFPLRPSGINGLPPPGRFPRQSY